MARRLYFRAMREYTENFLQRIRCCFQGVWRTLRYLCSRRMFVTPEEAYRYQDSVSVSHVFTDCNDILKPTVSTSVQTDSSLFNNTLYYLGYSKDDNMTQRKNANKKRSGRTVTDNDVKIFQNNAAPLNGEGDYDKSRNTETVRQSKKTTCTDECNHAPQRTLKIIDCFGEMRGENYYNESERRRLNFNSCPANIFTVSVSKTAFHNGRKRSIGSSATIKQKNMTTQTIMSIPSWVIAHPPSPISPKTPEKTQPFIRDATIGPTTCSETMKQASLGGESAKDKVVSNGSEMRKETSTSTGSDTGNARKILKARKPLGLDRSNADKFDVRVVRNSKKTNKNEDKTVKDDNVLVKIDKAKAVSSGTPADENSNTITKNCKSIVKADTNSTVEKKVSSATEPDVAKQEKGANAVNAETQNRPVLYERENYIKVMLLKIVEKIPHIKRMKMKQDSLPEGDPERERIYKIMNAEIKKHISDGLDKFYIRYNQLHVTQKNNTAELEKNFLMDLIAEMKKADKEFLAEEQKAQGDGCSQKREDKHTNQKKSKESKHNKTTSLSEDRSRKASNSVSGDAVAEEEMAASKTKHYRKHRQRRSKSTEHSTKATENMTPEVNVSDVPLSNVEHVEPVNNEEDISGTKLETEEVGASITNESKEEGAIMIIMRNMEREASSDGLFSNWDATPFGDIADAFDRGHYRIDGQTVVSKGSKGYKIEDRPQKIKRRGIPNKHLSNTNNYLYENADDNYDNMTQNEDEPEIETNGKSNEKLTEIFFSEENLAEKTLQLLNSDKTDTSQTTSKTEDVVDTRHLQTEPCDVILKKKGECDLLEEKYSVSKPQKSKVKQKKKKVKKTAFIAANISNNAVDDGSSDETDDSSDSDYDDCDSESSDNGECTSDEAEEDVVLKMRISQYTEMLQSIP